MFRNALRQSSRTVGAFAATSRVASVSAQNSSNKLKALSKLATFPFSMIGSVNGTIFELLELQLAFAELRRDFVHLATTMTTNSIRNYRLAASHQLSTAAMLLMPRQLPLRFLPSWSSAFVASPRRRPSPRPVAFSLLGMNALQKTIKLAANDLEANEEIKITDRYTSDGIARVHGMSNVQAEELVEYVDTNLACSNDIS